LVSGDSHLLSPYDIFQSNETFLQFIENEKIIHWYSQNCLVQHPKITKIPIGMDYHTLSSNENHYWGNKSRPFDQEKELDMIHFNAKPFWDRKIKCYSNFHFSLHSKYGNPRKRATETIPVDCIYYEERQTFRDHTWKQQIQYAFVVSPPGHGWDCHRTWEALLLGCIVIVEKSNIDDLYDDLPVLIVDNFQDISMELLEKTVIEFKEKNFNYNKLLLSYWIKKINNEEKGDTISHHDERENKVRTNISQYKKY
jgi:hypothetical protein